MVLLLPLAKECDNNLKKIYIPIWCYFYNNNTYKSVPNISFTFQYGATSTVAIAPVSSKSPRFTFQYGATSTLAFLGSV